jgi:hypothetical protein
LVNFCIWRVVINWVLWIPKSLVQVFSETPSLVTSVHTQVQLHIFYTHHSAIIINCVTYNVVQSMKHYHSPKQYNLLNNFSKQNIVYEKNPYNLCFTRDILPCLSKGINWSDLFSIPVQFGGKMKIISLHCTPQGPVYNFTWLMLPSYTLKA